MNIARKAFVEMDARDAAAIAATEATAEAVATTVHPEAGAELRTAKGATQGQTGTMDTLAEENLGPNNGSE